MDAHLPEGATAPAAVGGNRLDWTDLPATLRTMVEHHLGTEVIGAVSRSGGFSPGLAATLRLGDGRRVFAKAINADRSLEGSRMHRNEIRNLTELERLADAVPYARLLYSHDDGEWVLLLLEDIDGNQPAEPWRDDELTRVLDAIATLSRPLTPAPFEAERLADWKLDGWRQIAGDADRSARLAGVDPWASANLDLLLDLESRWPEAADGETLLHLDLRADNILLTPERVVFVDWAHVMVGAAYIDLLALLPSVAMHGTDPEPIVRYHPVTRNVDPATIDVVIGTLAGFFVAGSMRPPIPLLPTIRDFQLAQGRAVLGWLTRRDRA